jgi:PAS domain S-box-containing protein
VPGAGAEIYLERGTEPDGRWLHITARPLAGPQAGAVTVISDITGRKQAEEEIRALSISLESTVQLRTAQLRQQTRYLRVLIDTIPWRVWFKDTGSRYLAANRAAAAALGTECEHLIGQSDFDVKPPAVASAWRDDDLKVMGSRRPQTVEELQDGPQGPSWVETFKVPVFDDDGAVLGTVGLARDVSARKQAESARDQALLEAQRLAQLRSDFLAHMSHELRTPLHAVLGFVQLLRRGGGLVPDQLSSVDAIGHSGEHLQGLINNVLDSAQLEAGRMLLVPQPVELAPFLNGIITMMQGRAADKGLAFRWTVEDGLPGMLVADEQRLRQVLLNLLSNAIKFTDRGGVTLELAHAGPRQLRFGVRDSGIGIAAEALGTIFQPFEQAGDASRRAAGTGLGLAISRQLVRLMGSDIQVESQPGTGSRFWFELAVPQRPVAEETPPLVLAACAAAEPLTPPPPPLLEDLLHLVRIGNMRTILDFAQALERQDPRYAPFAARVSRLAQHYQSQALRQLVEDHLQ